MKKLKLTKTTMEKPIDAIENLTNCQRQLDFDGSEVGVSRQALCMALEWAEGAYTQTEKLKQLQDDLTYAMSRIGVTITGHCPRELCTTLEAVEWLVDRHKAATEANLKLDEVRTENLAAKGLGAEASAVSAARVILRKSKNISDQ